jgi:hypothetical protein
MSSQERQEKNYNIDFNEIRELFGGSGFTEINYFSPDKYHYCLVFRRQDQAQDDKPDLKSDPSSPSVSSQENETGRNP